MAVGGGGLIGGIAAWFAGHIKIVAVEPSESAVLSGRRPGSHKIDGVGAGFVVPLWREDVADQIDHVSTEEAMAMARSTERTSLRNFSRSGTCR